MSAPELPLAQLVAESRTIHAMRCDAGERLTWANATLVRTLARAVDGLALADVFAPVSTDAIRRAVDQSSPEALLVQLDHPGATRTTLRVHVMRLEDGFSLAGEPLGEHQRMLEDQLLVMNAALATQARERAVQLRTIDQLYRELRDAHWHIRKTTSVLPMCMSCKAVKADDVWQEAAQFLVSAGEFVSHGYCVECTTTLLSRLERSLGLEH